MSMNKLNVLIIEPHPDDAVLSCYHHIKILRNVHNLYLVSIGNTSGNNRCSDEFCKFMGITYIDRPYIEDCHWDHRISPREIRKQASPSIYQAEYYCRYFHREYELTCEKISQVVADIHPVCIYTVVGILHPMHVLTSRAVDFVASNSIQVRNFADMPYVFRKYGENILLDYCNQRKVKVVSTLLPDPSEVREKLSIFNRFYPGERRAIAYDYRGFYTHPEKIVG